MPNDFIEFVTQIGTFALTAIAGIVFLLVLAAIIDRNPKRKTDAQNDMNKQDSDSKNIPTAKS